MTLPWYHVYKAMVIPWYLLLVYGAALKTWLLEVVSYMCLKAVIHYESADTHTSFDIHNRLELFHREPQLQHKQASAVLNTVGVFIDSITRVFPCFARGEK